MTLRISRAIPVLVAIACTACATAAAEPSASRDTTLATSVPSTDAEVISATPAATTAPTSASAATPPPTTIEGLAAITDGDGRVVILATGDAYDEALLSADGRTAVVVDRSSPGTTWLGWVDTATGEVTAAVDLEGDLQAVATDPDARFVGLVDRAGDREHDAIAPGRESTEVVVAGLDGETFRSVVAGNIVPEAFSDWTLPDGSGPGSVFVIDYQPPELPSHYRVRVLDLATGELGLPFNLRDKVQPVDQLMAGISRTAVVAAGDGLLFTLYRGHHDEGGDPYAFIHTLAFGNGVWCLEVPVEMELADLSGALVVSPDEEHLVAVSANGTVAKIAIADILDPEALPIFGEPVSVGAESDSVPAVAAGEDTIAAGLGSTVVLLDPDDLSVIARQDLPVDVEALDATDSGFVAAGGGRLFVLDESLAITAEAPAPASLGSVSRLVAD